MKRDKFIRQTVSLLVSNREIERRDERSDYEVAVVTSKKKIENHTKHKITLCGQLSD